MKSKLIRLIPILLIAVLLSACSGNAMGGQDEFGATYPSQILSGDVYVLKTFEKIEGNIIGFDTTLVIEEGASVLGDINLFASNLEIAGRVSGDINLFGGESAINRSGIVTGSINKIGNEQTIEPGAAIFGEINTFNFNRDDRTENIQIPEGTEKLLRPRTWIIFQIIRNIFLLLFNILIIFLFKDQTTRVVRKLQKELLVSWLAGLLTLFAVPFVSIILVITICLSPIGLILLILLAIINLWGWAVMSYFVGSQLASWFKLEPSALGIVAMGSVFFGIIFTILAFIPIISFVFSWIISSAGIGAIILSLISNRKRP
jgi:cytoskeletal protein CcmA (bactofilin family)